MRSPSSSRRCSGLPTRKARLPGVFIIKAAVLFSAKQVKGLDAVFRSVAGSAYGYGLYCLLEARYRDLTPGR
jgi:hypothetical protein